jgi:hypothetical protein
VNRGGRVLERKRIRRRALFCLYEQAAERRTGFGQGRVRGFGAQAGQCGCEAPTDHDPTEQAILALQNLARKGQAERQPG